MNRHTKRAALAQAWTVALAIVLLTLMVAAERDVRERNERAAVRRVGELVTVTEGDSVAFDRCQRAGGFINEDVPRLCEWRPVGR